MTTISIGKPVRVKGYVAAGFELVAEAFRENFAKGTELGASFAAYHRGKLVVDIWYVITVPWEFISEEERTTKVDRGDQRAVARAQ